MSTLKKILIYTLLFFIWASVTVLIMTTNFFEFNFPMSLMLLPLPFMTVVALLLYLGRKKNSDQ
jgi:hypothetical protein